MDKLIALFSNRMQTVLQPYAKELSFSREIRIRIGQQILLCGDKNTVIPGYRPDARDMEEMLLCFCGNALYAHEEQLMQGYVTLRGGHRVGVCGRMLMHEGKPLRFAQVQSLCVRLAKQMPCAKRALQTLRTADHIRSVLVISPPGFGKTTMLREMARSLSADGIQVALADERSELAACVGGVPQLDVGPCADVLDGMPKSQAIGLLVRAMSPQIVVSDEIGSDADAQAILDAKRCGVEVLCSAHAAGLQDVKSRGALSTLLQAGAFDRILLLRGRPGHVEAVYDREGRLC